MKKYKIVDGKQVEIIESNVLVGGIPYAKIRGNRVLTELDKWLPDLEPNKTTGRPTLTIHWDAGDGIHPHKDYHFNISNKKFALVSKDILGKKTKPYTHKHTYREHVGNLGLALMGMQKYKVPLTDGQIEFCALFIAVLKNKYPDLKIVDHNWWAELQNYPSEFYKNDISKCPLPLKGHKEPIENLFKYLMNKVDWYTNNYYGKKESPPKTEILESNENHDTIQTKADLIKIAKGLKLTNYSKLSKDELIKLIDETKEEKRNNG